MGWLNDIRLGADKLWNGPEDRREGQPKNPPPPPTAQSGPPEPPPRKRTVEEIERQMRESFGVLDAQVAARRRNTGRFATERSGGKRIRSWEPDITDEHDSLTPDEVLSEVVMQAIEAAWRMPSSPTYAVDAMSIINGLVAFIAEHITDTIAVRAEHDEMVEAGQRATIGYQYNKAAVTAEIAKVLNRHNVENVSNAPDFILAEYLTDCLSTFEEAVTQRSKWFGGQR